MSVADNPNVFRYEGRLWISTEPREAARAALVAQRAWDAQNARLQRWWVAIVIGAVVGVAATLALGTLASLGPAVYLLLLPVGFGIGAVGGALVNKRFFAPDPQHASLPARPVTPELVRVPARVAAKAPAGASTAELIGWSKRGFVS
jgi:hypothetical protein